MRVVKPVFLSAFGALSIFAFPMPSPGQSTRLPIPGSSFGVPGNASFDYVVIGGGTAGLAVAAKLAGDASISVAVIEAGAFYEVDNGNISVIPGDATFYTGTSPNDTQPLVDWGFDTIPQAVCSRLRRYHLSHVSLVVGCERAKHPLCTW